MHLNEEIILFITTNYLLISIPDRTNSRAKCVRSTVIEYILRSPSTEISIMHQYTDNGLGNDTTTTRFSQFAASVNYEPHLEGEDLNA